MIKVNNTYINGSFQKPDSISYLDLVNPSNEEIYGVLECTSVHDLEKAIYAAFIAQSVCMNLSVAERKNILLQILTGIVKRREEIAEMIMLEMGAPINLSKNAHIQMGIDHLENTIHVLDEYKFESNENGYKILKMPIGVAALITPWNWPLNQTLTKISSAIGAGCSIVMKPSEYCPLSSKIIAEIIDASDLPKGGFNMVNGHGSDLGPIISEHKMIDMISFTGSTEVGINIQQLAAKTIKRVSLELGGKSAHIICDDVDLTKAIPNAINQCFINSGQSCSAPTRLLVPENDLEKIKDIAKNHVESIITGDPFNEDTNLGPVINSKQFESIQSHIKNALETGCELVSGGIGRPDIFKNGYYIKPTIFANMSNNHQIAQEEIFGPVLSIITYKNLSEAVSIANDSQYGLSSYITSKDEGVAYKIAKQIKAGQTIINRISRGSVPAPFGGFKMSGNGREHGVFGLEEYLEIKAII
jgi:aldehyde dehydrogenase (NAD+)